MTKFQTHLKTYEDRNSPIISRVLRKVMFSCFLASQPLGDWDSRKAPSNTQWSFIVNSVLGSIVNVMVGQKVNTHALNITLEATYVIDCMVAHRLGP